MTTHETPQSHCRGSAWIQQSYGQSQEKLKKGESWLLTFGCALCWSKTTDLGRVEKHEHKEITEQSGSRAHTYLTWAGQGVPAFCISQKMRK